MADVYVITGAGSGFGALAARALALQGYTVYAGMYSHTGDFSRYEANAKAFAKDHAVDLRTVPLDLFKQESCDAAVKQILSEAGKLDAIIHNAGHIALPSYTYKLRDNVSANSGASQNYGPSESFTPEQYLSLYDSNVVGTQRLNVAALPYFRSQRKGHLIWISSTSVYGAKGPWLGGYFAAKAAMDTLAQSYARELNPWGIETTIVSPGIFTKGTNHFANAMQPGLPDVAKDYDEGPTKGVSEQNMKGTGDSVPEGAEPSVVADALVQLAAIPRGKKPYRMTADPSEVGGDIGAAVIDRLGNEFYRRLGLGSLLQVTV